jgi:hypothetical protein
VKGEKAMWGVIVLAVGLMAAGCAPSKACIGLLDKAESKYQDSLATVKREDRKADSDKKWKTMLSDFGEVQSYADESRRRYISLKREDPDKNALLRAELEQVDYFRRFEKVYACSLRMQGIALSNLGSYVYAEQKMKAGDLAAQEAEGRYKYAIDCGYPVQMKP